MVRNVTCSVAPCINFRPGLVLSSILTGLTYKKVAKRVVKKAEGEEEEGGEDLTD